MMLSAGVPMMVGGDEALRSINCNNNPYNLDSSANWLRLDAGVPTKPISRRLRKR